MARIYANENFPLPAVEELRHLGHEVMTTQDSGRAGQAIPDTEVLAFAAADRRILITMNRRHFVRLHIDSPDHVGIVVCTVDPDFHALAHRIDAELGKQPDMVGRLIRVNRPAAP